MFANEIQGEVERVSCEVCMKEVPLREAENVELTDYFVHFCGLECYAKWKGQGGNLRAATEEPAEQGPAQTHV